MNTRPIRKGQQVFAKINGNWFRAKVVKADGSLVRVSFPGDADREVKPEDVMTWAESQGRNPKTKP